MLRDAALHAAAVHAGLAPVLSNTSMAIAYAGWFAMGLAAGACTQSRRVR